MIDNLQRKNVWILDWFFICKCNGELVDHLLLYCLIAIKLWSIVCLRCWANLEYVRVMLELELLACWPGCFLRHQNGHLWMATTHYLMWCLWRERNNRSFKDIERTMFDLNYFSSKLCLIGC